MAPGEFVAIIGPNGAGKSTLLRALSGELTASEGRVSLDGVPIERVPRIELARRRAVLPQAVRLAFPMLAEEVVALGRTPHFGTASMREDQPAIAAAIGWAGMGHLRGAGLRHAVGRRAAARPARARASRRSRSRGRASRATCCSTSRPRRSTSPSSTTSCA